MIDVKIKLLHGGTMPSYSKEHDAGLDCCARTSGFILGGSSHTIPLGFAIAIPRGHVGLIMGRSGLASRNGIDMLGGVVDSGYTGEVHAILHNTDKYHDFQYESGDRVAQMIIIPCLRANLVKVDELEESARGDNAFGSTGR